MSVEYRAILVISDFPMAPARLEQTLGLRGDHVQRKGAPGRYGRGPIKTNRWSLCSTADPAELLEVHLASLLARLAPVWSALVAVCSQYQTQLTCEIWLDGALSPIIEFDAEVVKRFAELNCSIGFDLYGYG